MKDDPLGPPIRTSLPQPHSVDIGFMKKRAFHDQDVLIVNLGEAALGWDDKQLLINIGERLYGKRKPAGR